MYVRIAVRRGKKSKKKKKRKRYTYARGDSAANFYYDNRYFYSGPQFLGKFFIKPK